MHITNSSSNTSQSNTSRILTWLKTNYYYFWPVLLVIALLIQTNYRFRVIVLENPLTLLLIDSFKQVLVLVNSLTVLSLTELYVIVTVTLFFIFIVKQVISMFKIKKIKNLVKLDQSFIVLVSKAALILSTCYLFFLVLYGSSYSQDHIGGQFNLNTQPYYVDELKDVTSWLAATSSHLRNDRYENEQGVFALKSKRSEIFANYNKGYVELSKVYPEFKKNKVYPKPKAVKLSPYWSYTKTSGLYFPFLAEININTSIPDSQLPHTILHETAHFKGYAREDEANFLAFLSGIHHTDKDFNYSAVLVALNYCLSELAKKDKESYNLIIENMDRKVLADLEYNHNFWKNKTGFIGNITQKVNNQYLKINKQKDGINSYNNVTNHIAAWYILNSKNQNIENIENRLGVRY